MNSQRIMLKILIGIFSLTNLLILEAETKEEKISTLLMVTGITEQTRSIPSLINAMLMQQGHFFSSDQQVKILQILMKNFSEINFNLSISKEVLNNFNMEYCDRILHTYNDKLFIKITESEVYSSNSDALPEIQTFDYSLVSESRYKIIEDYLSTSDSIKNQEIIALSSIEAFFNIFNLFLPMDKKINDEQLRSVLSQTKTRIYSPQQIEAIKKQYAFTYRDYDDGELVKYLNYYQSDEMMWLMNQFQKGLLDGYKLSMTNTALQIISEFNLQSNHI